MPKRHARKNRRRLRILVRNGKRELVMEALGPREYDELLRRVRELESLEERAMAAWEVGDYGLAEELDEVYAERVEELEAIAHEMDEGNVFTDREPEQTEGGVDLLTQLANLYAEYLDDYNGVASRFYGHDGPERDDVLVDLARKMIENDAGRHIDAAPDDLAAAARDAYERKRDLLRRYRDRPANTKEAESA